MSRIDQLFWRVYPIVMGNHPNNTFFSFNWHNVRHINKFLARVCSELPTGSVLADIGGGRSPYFFHFEGIVEKYIAVDLQESLPPNESRAITQLEGTAENIPLDDASVDIVLCNQVLEHVIDPVKSVTEMHRILKPGGYFIGSVPHVSPVHLEPYDFRRFTDLGVTQLLKQQGFRNISVEGNGGVFSAAALMIGMDVLMSRRVAGQPQGFDPKLALAIAPVIALINLGGLALDKLTGNRGRTPANLCWIAQKKGKSKPKLN